MDTLKEVINFIIGISDAGATARVIYCCIKLNANPDDQKLYEKRIKHAIEFAIVANLIWVIKGIAEYYYL